MTFTIGHHKATIAVKHIIWKQNNATNIVATKAFTAVLVFFHCKQNKGTFIIKNTFII